jgi:DtxR family Mn-dependent transcriptional regulator
LVLSHYTANTLSTLSESEENYLKSIYRLQGPDGVTGKELAERLASRPASITEMLGRLSAKGFVEYEKYRPITLTPEGKRLATQIIRRHRLWEVFLVEKLGFAWNEIHEVAEQLEHVRSDALIERLDRYLGHPRVDPHGDLIPDKQGNYVPSESMPLTEAKPDTALVLKRVADDSEPFLQYLTRVNLSLGKTLTLRAHNAFDDTLEVEWDGLTHTLSRKTAGMLLVGVESEKSKV